MERNRWTKERGREKDIERDRDWGLRQTKTEREKEREREFLERGRECDGFPGGSVVKNMPAMREMRVWSLDQEDPLEKEMATPSNIFAWGIPWTEEPGGLQSMEFKRVRHDLLTKQQQQGSVRVNAQCWVWILIIPLWLGDLDRSLHHCGPQFPHLEDGPKNSPQEFLKIFIYLFGYTWS